MFSYIAHLTSVKWQINVFLDLPNFYFLLSFLRFYTVVNRETNSYNSAMEGAQHLYRNRQVCRLFYVHVSLIVRPRIYESHVDILGCPVSDSTWQQILALALQSSAATYDLFVALPVARKKGGNRSSLTWYVF